MKRKYKKLRKSRGFTMVELLATIVILGILTTISIVAIQKVIVKAKDRYYISQENSMTAAGRNYAEKNTQYLPKISGQMTQISLAELEKSKYISTVMDYNKNKCSNEDSYVQIYKYENDYYYTAYLACPVYTTDLDARNAEYDPFTVKLTGNISDLNGTITMKEKKEGIASYSYTVYKDNKVVFQSEQFEMHKTKDTITKKISLKEYIPGEVKLTVTAINGAGISKTKSDKINIVNNSTAKLKCGTITGAGTSWTTGSRTIKVKCIDDGGVGCAKPEFIKKFDSEQKNGTIKIYDLDGNSKDCSVSVMIDRTPPTLPKTNLYTWKDNSTTPTTSSGLSSYTAGKWSSKKIFTKPSGSTDATSGGVYYQYKITGAVGNKKDQKASYYNATVEGESTIAYRACDAAGNCSDYNTASSIKIDWSKPTTPTIKGGSSSWYTTNRIIWVSNLSTSKSGISKYQYCYQTANDSSKCTWKNLSNNTNGVSNGIDVAYYHANNGDLINAFGGNVSSLVSHYDSNGKGEKRKPSDPNWLRTAQNFSSEGTYYVFFRAVSNSGLTSNASSVQTLKIDKHKPKIVVTAYKRNSAGNSTGSSLGSKTSTSTATLKSYSNTHNTWFNTDYPYGVYYKVEVSDNLGLKNLKWQWNDTGLTTYSKNYKDLTGASDYSLSGTSQTKSMSLSGEGQRVGLLTLTDTAGNSVTMNIEANIDRTRPATPSGGLAGFGSPVGYPASSTTYCNPYDPDYYPELQIAAWKYNSGTIHCDEYVSLYYNQSYSIWTSWSYWDNVSGVKDTYNQVIFKNGSTSSSECSDTWKKRCDYDLGNTTHYVLKHKAVDKAGNESYPATVDVYFNYHW
ncbi:MAG: type II secretion system protein [Bacilli bacterium]|nr:type II secretion system protein [Bacilli bacterium]